MRDVGLGDKVYSPDLQTFELEGASGVFGTLASIIVGPIRIMTRVTHNIFVMPATLQVSYANSLLVISALLALVGLFEILVFRKWPLLVSQIPALLVALKLRISANRATVKSKEKREVHIDREQVTELCESLYTELDNITGGELK